jgi:hypothetical protein
MKTLKKHLPALLAISIGMSAGVVHGQVTLFSDDFTTDTSANWTVQPGSGNAINDYTAEFGFNYATNRFIRNGVTNTIPLAPNSTVGVATNGIKITINNNDEVAATAAVNLYPVSQSFSNDYALKFDMWINYNGGEFGGTGSTEFSIFGLNMSGTLDNWTGADLGDGVWFGVTGEGGAARDWRAYVGDAVIPGAPLELLDVSGGFLDRDNSGTAEQESFTDPDTYPLKLLFPKPTYETAAVPGKQWVQVEVRQRTNDTGNHVVTWLVNGYVIAQLSPDQYLQTNGNIMIGAMDIFASIADPRAENFFIFDNVRVVDMSGVETVDVSIVATQPGASEPATDGVMTITRTGSTASPLVVPFRTAGSATRGADYVTQTNGVTFTANAITIPAGQTSVDITIKTQDDGIGESPEQAYLVLDGKPSAYDIGLNAYAIVEIADDGDTPEVTVAAFRRAAYEGNTNSYGQFRVLFSNPFPAGDVNVNYTLTGTAVNGTHYQTIAGAVTITAGLTEAFVTVLPIDNADTVSNRTVILTLGTGSNYKLAATNTNTTVTIFNDDLPAAITSLYSEDFDVDTSTSWSVFFGTTDVTRDRATFAYDYSADGIPAAPRSTGGTTRGLKMEANVISLGSALFSGLSASPNGQNFTGDYRMRFNWWINFPGPLAAGGSGSTQLGTYGITRGTRAQWPGSTAGTDSIFFAMSGDGGTNPDIRAYTNGGAVLPAGLTYYAAPTLNNTDAYYSVFGNLAAPDAQLQTPFGGAQTGRTSLGAPGLVWHDVVLTKLGNTLVWEIDGVLMARVNAAKVGFNLSTNIFVGHTDINAGQSTLPEMLFSLYDNLVVESLPVPSVTITNITLAGTNAVLTFTGGTNDPAAAYILQQAPIVVGPYTNTLSATITNVSEGVFRAITPVSGDTRFYRILR